MSRSAPARSPHLCLRSPAWCWRRDHDAKGRRTGMRRPRLRKSQTRLRAGVPVAVNAQICSRRRIVGLVGLHAVSDVIAADGSRRDCDGAVIVVLVIVIARRIVTRPAIVAVALRRDGAADHRTCNRAGDKAAAAAIAAAVAAAITAATATDAITTAAAAAAKASRRSATATAGTE